MIPNTRQLYQLTGVVVHCYNPYVYETDAMPKNALSWMEQAKRLKDARALAEFLDLRPDGAERFIKDHRSFVPPVWWTGRAWKDGVGIYSSWMRERDLLRKAWAAGFPADTTLGLATTNLFLIAHALASDTTEEMESTPQSIWPYQRAVLFLHVESWRVKEPCPQCGRHFIATHSQQQCCSVRCSADWRQQYKAERHKQIKVELNARRRREYAAKKKITR
jgi:hypothetical protein